jgi:hypothetical protein
MGVPEDWNRKKWFKSYVEMVGYSLCRSWFILALLAI